jgi:hypothetical protein
MLLQLPVALAHASGSCATLFPSGEDMYGTPDNQPTCTSRTKTCRDGGSRPATQDTDTYFAFVRRLDWPRSCLVRLVLLGSACKGGWSVGGRRVRANIESPQVLWRWELIAHAPAGDSCDRGSSEATLEEGRCCTGNCRIGGRHRGSRTRNKCVEQVQTPILRRVPLRLALRHRFASIWTIQTRGSRRLSVTRRPTTNRATVRPCDRPAHRCCWTWCGTSFLACFCTWLLDVVVHALVLPRLVLDVNALLLGLLAVLVYFQMDALHVLRLTYMLLLLMYTLQLLMYTLLLLLLLRRFSSNDLDPHVPECQCRLVVGWGLPGRRVRGNNASRTSGSLRGSTTKGAS